MPNIKKTSSLEPFALLYKNGAPAISGQVHIPLFADICLDKNSQSECDDVIETANSFTRAIQNDKECQDYIALHALVDETLVKLKKLEKRDRDPFTKGLIQISAALEPLKMKLTSISGRLKTLITKWREQEVEGRRREEERLRVKAEEKRNEAKYTDDPQKARKATVQAKALEKEADEIAPVPQKGGVDTEEYFEATEISSRVLAAKLPGNIVLMEVDQTELNKHLKALKHAGQKFTPNILPGLTIERKTRVRFHK